MLDEINHHVTRCSAAYSERRQALVERATRLSRTIGEDEFETPVTFVRGEADKHEKEVVGGDRF